ncbi:MAG: hypothetical protein ACC707_02510 [Thiohalomonadales bacterium]
MIDFYPHTLRFSALVLISVVLVSCTDPSPEPPVPAIQFPANIAAIFSENCINCHTDENVGAFSLLPEENGWQNTVDNIDTMRSTIVGKQMPPFLAQPFAQCDKKFENAFSMTAADIQSVSDWLDQGLPAGPEDAAAIQIPALPTLAGEVYAVTMTEEYTPKGVVDGHHEDVRCFVVDGMMQDKMLVGYDVVAGNNKNVHHVQLYTTTSLTGREDARTFADQKEVGYSCYGGSQIAPSNVKLLASWSPGSGATHYPAGTGLLVKGHTDPLQRPQFIVQIHYLVKQGTAPGADRSTVNLQLVDTNSVMQADILALTDDNRTINFQADDTKLTFNASTKNTRINDVEIRAIMPHMHDLGASVQVNLSDANAIKNCLINIPDWSYEWQRFFYFDSAAAPIILKASDTILTDCNYKIPEPAAAIIEGFDDGQEHCITYLYVVPVAGS